MSDGGKGSKPRPYSVSQEEYDKRWDAIFQRDTENESVKDLVTEDCMTMEMPGTIGAAKVVMKK